MRIGAPGSQWALGLLWAAVERGRRPSTPRHFSSLSKSRWGLGLAGQQIVVVDEEYLAGALGPLAAIPPRNGLPPNTPVLKCKSWKMHVSGAHLPTKSLQYQVHA